MKNLSIFAVSTPNSKYRFIRCIGIFYACISALAVNIRAIPSHGHLYLISLVFEFGDLEGGSPSFVLEYLNFSIMPNSRKNASMVNNSTHISTDSHETALFLISELNKLASSLPTKLSININIIIGNNNITNSGIVCGDLSINPQNI